MNVSIMAATERETAPVRESLQERLHALRRHRFTFVETGVGSMHAALRVMDHLKTHRPDLAIQVGIAGTFDPLKHPIGSAVVVAAEAMGDLGVTEADGSWRNLFELGFADPDEQPYRSGWLENPHVALLRSTGLPSVKAVTVNRISTDPHAIDRIGRTYAPAVESMEGAAFHYACLLEGTPFVQFRGVSNRVGDRDKSRWRIGESMQSVQESLTALLFKITQSPWP